MYRQRFIEMADENRGWFIALGIIMTVLGMASIALPYVMTLTTEVLVGSMILVAGFVQIVHAFGKEKWGAILMELTIGVLYVLGGIAVLANPIVGIIALTLLLAAVFVAEGATRVITAFYVRPNPAWVWMIISGAVSILAGGLLGAGLPSTATWAVGLLVGINLLMSGASFLALAIATGNYRRSNSAVA